MTASVRLAYRRDEGANTSSGYIACCEVGFVTETPFQNLAFRDMLLRLSAALMTWPKEQLIEVLLQRLDLSARAPYTLDAATVSLIRNDPEAAVQAMEFPTQSPLKIVQRVQDERQPLRAAPIRAGHATLADAFGDEVYCRLRKHEVECPGCGFWSPYCSASALPPAQAPFVCLKKCKSVWVFRYTDAWAVIPVDSLLAASLSAFYLPRAWNEGRPWIGREHLEKKYNEYIAEKEKVRCLERLL